MKSWIVIFNETIISKLLFEFGQLRAFIAGSEAVTLFFVPIGKYVGVAW
ncbi:hypothetical protein ACIQAA_30610 [Neobacillus sp. NPDC093182]